MMEPFQIVRQFFTRHACRFCGQHFAPDDIHLIGRGANYYVVAIHCHQCGKHNGDAAVGIEHAEPKAMPVEVMRQMHQAFQHMLGHAMGAHAGEPIEISLEDLLEAIGQGRRQPDPELTENDIRRLEDLPPIAHDDVLSAHEFLETLDSGWMQHIPEALRQSVSLEDAVDDDQDGSVLPEDASDSGL